MRRDQFRTSEVKPNWTRATEWGARVERQLRADDEEPDRKPNGAESNTEQGEQAIVCKCLSTKAKWRKFGAFAIEGGLQ